MTSRRRLAIARLSHEGNSFCPRLTSRADFARREWVRGAEARALYAGTRSELGAAVAFLEDHAAEWDGVFLRCCAAPPGGPVDPALLRGLREEIVEGLASGGPWDAVYLCLHGALLGESELTPELDLVRAVRACIGTAPLALSFDLHANLDPALGAQAEIILGYKTYPHVDTFETGAKALALLADAAIRRRAPVSRIVALEALLPSFNMRTEAGPMAEVAAQARALERRFGLLDVTPFGGFAYADSATAGASVSACADGDAALAQRAAEELAGFFKARRARFQIDLPEPAAALREALAAARPPVAVLEPADNPLSGGLGDTPGLFRALLAARPRASAAFAFFWDPDLVARAGAAGPGAVLDCRLGGRLGGDYGEPVPVRARVLRLTDGRFVNQGPMERGLPVELGPTAVLEVEGISVIVTSACVAPNDPAYFALHGLDLNGLHLLCAKAKNHFRAAFARTFSRILDVDTPGPAALDLQRLPYRRVPRARLPAVSAEAGQPAS